MPVADFLLGSAALVIGLVPWLVAAPRLARRLVPDRGGAETALVASVIGIGGVVVVAQLLGSCVSCGAASNNMVNCADKSCREQLVVCAECSAEQVFCETHAPARV